MAPYGSHLLPRFGTGSKDLLHSAAQPLILPTVQHEIVEEIADRHSERQMRLLSDLIAAHVIYALCAHIDPEDPLQRSFVDPHLGHRRTPRTSLDTIEGKPSHD